MNFLDSGVLPKVDLGKENYFKRAYGFYGRGEYAEAARLFGGYESLKGVWLKNYAEYFRAICFFKLRDFREADLLLSGLAAGHPHFPFYKNAIYYLAVSEEKNGYAVSAISHFKYLADYADKSSVRSYALFRIYRIYVKNKNYGLAGIYRDRLFADYPVFSRAHGISVNAAVLPKRLRIKRALSLYYDSYYSESLSLLNGLAGKNKDASFIALKDLMGEKSPLFLGRANECLSGKGLSCYVLYGVKNVKVLDLKARYYYYALHDSYRTLRILNYMAEKYGYLDGRAARIYREISWARVLMLLKGNEYAGAAGTLKSFLSVNENVDRQNAKFFFWYGIVLDKLGFPRRGAFYLNLVKDSRVLRYSYYGLMSAAASGGLLDSPGFSVSDGSGCLNISKTGVSSGSGAECLTGYDAPGKPGGALEFIRYLGKNPGVKKSFMRFKAFFDINLGFLSDTALFRFAKKAEKDLPAGMQPGGSGMMEAETAYMLKDSGDYAMAIGLASRLTGNTAYRYLLLNKNFLEILYPRPYLAYVRKYAFHYGVPLNLIYGVMRQESRYNPYCYSSASAIGLMQIIPSTGYYIARKTGCYGFHPSMLYMKKINISFGSYYLKTLLNQFYNKKYLAIASYNAGPGAVSYWKKELLRNDGMLLFIESIPIFQTRDYVKKVLANYYVYDSLYG